MKESRKLAWVVLGVVVLGSVVLLVQLSSIYSPWQKPRLWVEGTSWIEGSRNPYYYKQRYQRYPWLPGADEVSVGIEKEEFLMLEERARR